MEKESNWVPLAPAMGRFMALEQIAAARDERRARPTKTERLGGRMRSWLFGGTRDQTEQRAIAKPIQLDH